MILTDKVYGKEEINEKVLLQLLESKPLQRLKDISQSGISRYVLPNRNVTRYEHSVGVLIILRRHKAEIKEQIAGLIHDISHTAFSHVADYVFDDKNQEFHEHFFDKVLLESDIPKILKVHKLDIDFLLNKENFFLLEKPIPDLCADRIDYFLRDMQEKEENNIKIKKYLFALNSKDNQFYFKDRLIAKSFAEDFMRMNEEIWANPKELVLYKVFADSIKLALSKGDVSEEDLFETDSFFMNKLSLSSEKKIRDILQTLKEINYLEDNSKNSLNIHAKARWVDPLVLEDNKLIRATSLFPDLKNKIENHKARLKEGFSIRLN